MRTETGTIEIVGASGAALDHWDSSIRAGLNLYVLDDGGGLASAEAHVRDPVRGVFEKRRIDLAGDRTNRGIWVRRLVSGWP